MSLILRLNEDSIDFYRASSIDSNLSLTKKSRPFLKLLICIYFTMIIPQFFLFILFLSSLLAFDITDEIHSL